jgi:uncharacterized membrane protein
MALAAVTAYNVSIFIHVTAALIGFGATFAEAIAFPVAMQAGKRHLPYVHRLGLAINTRLTAPALVVVLATGIYQVSKADLSFGDGWISGTFAILIVIGGLNGAYFIPEDRRLATMAEADVAAAGDGEVVLSDEYQRRARIEGMVGGLAGLLVVAAVFLMVVKPGA